MPKSQLQDWSIPKLAKDGSLTSQSIQEITKSPVVPPGRVCSERWFLWLSDE